MHLHIRLCTSSLATNSPARLKHSLPSTNELPGNVLPGDVLPGTPLSTPRIAARALFRFCNFLPPSISNAHFSSSSSTTT